MPLRPFRIVKNWLFNTKTREENWSEIADKVGAFANETNNNLKQIGLDSFGPTYDYNNNGVGSQTSSLTTRVTALEAANFDIVGAKNLALDLSTPSKVKIFDAGGDNLSASNPGYATFNSTTTAGLVVTRQITANLEVTLTGCHWGYDTFGDLTDHILYVFLIDTGSAVILGVGDRGNRMTVTTADDETAVGNVTTADKVLVSTALGSENNCIVVASIKADFDDTGNAGGENFWTLQSAVGDVWVGYHQPRIYGEIFF